MLTITKKLDISPRSVPHSTPQVINVSQYDSDFEIQFKLYASTGTFTIEEGTTAAIKGTKPSGTGYSADASIDIETKTVTVSGDVQMTAVAGRCIYEIAIYKDNKEINSANFILLVERAALDADTITDESVLRNLEAIVEGAETATQAADDAVDAKTAAEAAQAAAEAAAEQAEGAIEVDDTLSVEGRAADAKKTGDEITSLKSVLYDRIIYVGKGNAYAEYTYDAGLKAGKTYRVFVNKWDTTGITVTTGYMFKLGYSDGGEITYKFEHYGNDSSVLKEYYDVTIPNDATDVLLAIGGRATGNAILTVEDAELYLNDAELYLNIENLQNTKVNQEDIIGLITGHIPTVQKLVKKFVTYHTTFNVMSFSAEAGRRYRIDVTNIDALVGADICIRVYNGTASVYNAPGITGDISANTKWTYYFNCLSTEVVTVQIYRSGLTEDATFSVGVQCDDDRRDIDKLDSEVLQVSADVDMNVSRNLIGPDVDVLYPVAPLKTGDVITASAFNPSGVTTWCHVRFHASDGTQLWYFQFDTGNASTGRTVTLNLGDSTAYFISVSRDCGSPLMVERGTKTDFVPHYTTNYENYLNSDSDFGEFELFLPDQAEIIRKNLATARMAKRLCFGHTSDNHSTVYPFICNIIDF